MARTSMAKVPSSGICIDRQDWLGHVNPRADDRRTWFPVGNSGQHIPVRALINSWKPAMAALARVWHAGGQLVIINDHSNRLDMMENVDGIYAEMGDMDPEGMAHAVGSGLAGMNLPVWIWNHDKPAATLTRDYLARGLGGHLLAGVFPTVPVKNNDHAIGGDCAPNCSYDGTFVDYGAMFVALRGRRWVLAARAAQVAPAAAGGPPVALANAFSTTAAWIAPGGSAAVYLSAVVFAPRLGRVSVTLRGVDAVLGCGLAPNPGALKAVVVQPGDMLDAAGRAVPGSFPRGSCGAAAVAGRNDARGCAAITSVAEGAGADSVVVTLQFGGSLDVSGPFTNAALLALRCA